MRFKQIFLFLFIFSCTTHVNNISSKKPFNSKGFAYVYNNFDFNEKIIKRKMDNNSLELSHQNLRTGTLIKLINPKNKKSLVLKNIKRVKYPDFYKILITKPVAEELDLNLDLPLVEIIEIKKNKSFIAQKAKIYNEEKKIPSKAPVASVQISNISKNKDKNKKNKNSSEKIYIHIASFYSIQTAQFLKTRIIEEINELDSKKLYIKKINDKETQVILGPYTSVNLLKNDYIKLKNYGFEEMDIFINE